MRFLLLALAGALLCVPERLESQGTAASALARNRKVAVRFDSAWTLLAEAARRDSSTFAWLLELDRLKEARIGWAFEQDGEILAITTSRRDAYLVVVPKSDPAYTRMGSVMETDGGASVRATRVKADSIAVAWAAVFLSYELSHIRDDLLGILPESAKPGQLAASSRRAYTAEYLALRALGGRALEQHFDSILTAVAPASVVSLAEGLLPVLRQSFGRFDALLTKQAALTEREEQRRAGVYAVALLLRYAESRGVSDEEFARAVRCIGGCR